jgi:hypothetical protein
MAMCPSHGRKLFPLMEMSASMCKGEIWLFVPYKNLYKQVLLSEELQ